VLLHVGMILSQDRRQGAHIVGDDGHSERRHQGVICVILTQLPD
jgi:hypothetical protein